MQRINRIKFFTLFRKHFGNIKQSQVDGLNFLLDKLDQSDLILRISEYAYVLATIAIECNWTWQPVVEAYWIKPEWARIAALKTYYYRLRKSMYPFGKLFAGQGFVQLSTYNNYVVFNKLVKKRFPDKDIVENPEQAREPEIAWVILEEGMTSREVTFKDESFTGYVLRDFFNDRKMDFYNARKIINGLSGAGKIAGIAVKIYDCLEFEEAA